MRAQIPARTPTSVAGEYESSIGEITIAPQPLPRPLQCVDYSATLSASGGVPPYTFSVTSGALPPGLSLSPQGVLSGVPSTFGASAFTLSASDSHGWIGTAEYTLPVSVGYAAPDNQVELPIPPIGSGGSGVPASDVTVSTLVVSGVSSAVAVAGLDVHVTLRHERAGDLVLTLVTPDGVRIELANQLGGNGADYLATVFGDAAQSPVCTATAPFTGVFRPAQPIGARLANGTWTLEIEDELASNTGRLLDWSLDVLSALAGQPVGGDCNVWYCVLPPWTPLQGFSTTATDAYVSAGTEVRRIVKQDSAGPGNWTRDFVFITPIEPLFVERVSPWSPIVAVAATNGFVYALDASDGSTLWSRDTRRPGCAGDSLSTPPAVQRWQESDCAFRAAIPSDDLIFVGTHFGCGTNTANKVFGLRASDGTVQWQFNFTGAYQVNYVNGLTVDASRNRLYVVSHDNGSVSNQLTVWCLNSITGTKLLSRSLGAVDARAVVGDRGVYVLTRAGTLYRLDPDTFADHWSLPLGAVATYTDFAFDPLRHRIYTAGSDLVLRAIQDDGSSASIVWTKTSMRSVVVAPFLNKLYASSYNAWVHQLDPSTGASQGQGQLVNGNSGLRMSLDHSVGDGLAEARLMVLNDSFLCRGKVPWIGSSYHHFGGGIVDSPIGPSIDLALQGTTTPSNPGVGQMLTDTLTVKDWGNRAPRCAELRVAMPAGMSWLGATSSQGAIAIEGGELVVRLGAVPMLTSIDIAVDWQMDTPGLHPRTYVVSSTEYPESHPSNNTLVLGN